MIDLTGKFERFIELKCEVCKEIFLLDPSSLKIDFSEWQSGSGKIYFCPYCKAEHQKTL